MAPVRPRRPLGAAPTLVSARVQESRPRNGRGKSGHIAKHDLDDVPDSIDGILRPSATGERLNIIHVPKFHVLFALRILVALAPSLDLPEGEGIFERLVLLLLEHQEAAVAVVVELGHHRPIGIEGIADDGVDEPSVGLVQGIDQTPPGGQFAFMASCSGSISRRASSLSTGSIPSTTSMTGPSNR